MPAAAAIAATSTRSPDRNAELIRYINLKLAALGQPTSRSTGGSRASRNRRAPAAQLPPEGPIARQPALPGRHAHPGVSRELLERRLSATARRGCRSIRLRAGPRRHGARHVVAARARTLSHRPCLTRIAARRASCTIRKQRQAHHAGSVSHRRGRPAGSRRQDGRSQAGVRGTVGRGATSSGGRAGAAVHRRPGGPGSLLRLSAAAAAGLSGDRTTIRKRPWRSASSRPGAWSAISISWKAFSATAAIRIFPKTTPRSTRCIGPATRAASCWRRTWSA